VAVNIATPLGEEVAKNRSEFIGVNAGFEVRNGPAAEGANSIEGLVLCLLHPGFSSFYEKQEKDLTKMRQKEYDSNIKVERLLVKEVAFSVVSPCFPANARLLPLP
jgi:hypothetical protein